MTFFGFLWILILICSFSNISLLAFLTVLSSVLQCANVLVIGNTGIGPQVLTSLVFIIRIIISSKFKLNVKLDKLHVCKYGIILIFVCFISSIINHTINKSFLRILQLIVYLATVHCMFYAGRFIKEDHIYKNIKRMSIALVIIGFIQLLSTSNVLPRLSILNILIYNDTSIHVYYYRNHYNRILSTFMEPSYYAGFVVGAFFYFLAYRKKRQNSIGILILLMIQIILTFSSSAYVSFVMIGVLYLFLSPENKFKYEIIILGVIGFIIMYIFFYDILDMVIFSKLQSESGVARASWNRAAMRLFKASPIIGKGYHSSRASNVIITLLGEMGIIGLISYLLMNSNLVRNIISLHKKKEFNEEFALSLSVLSVIVTQFIAVPDLQICTYWMWMYLLALRLSTSKKHDYIIPQKDLCCSKKNTPSDRS